MKKNYFKIILDLSNKAAKRNEVPVAALIVKNNKIIAKAYNQREKKSDIMAHAEIICIKKAAKKIKNWNLSDCDLYVSLKPCKMCYEVINQSRISNVYYLLEKPDFKKEYNKSKFIKTDSIYQSTYQHLLTSFFKNKRK